MPGMVSHETGIKKAGAVPLYEVPGGKCKRNGDGHSMFEMEVSAFCSEVQSADGMSLRLAVMSYERYLSSGTYWNAHCSLILQRRLVANEDEDEGMPGVAAHVSDWYIEVLPTAHKLELIGILQKLLTVKDLCCAKQMNAYKSVFDVTNSTLEVKAVWKNQAVCVQINT